MQLKALCLVRPIKYAVIWARDAHKAASAALLKLGVIARAMPQGDIFGFAPPLCLTRAEADTVVEKTKEAVDETFAAG